MPTIFTTHQPHRHHQQLTTDRYHLPTITWPKDATFISSLPLDTTTSPPPTTHNHQQRPPLDDCTNTHNHTTPSKPHKSPRR
eukprot:4184096-Alexandrium_andersonii.AAC.1